MLRAGLETVNKSGTSCFHQSQRKSQNMFWKVKTSSDDSKTGVALCCAHRADHGASMCNLTKRRMLCAEHKMSCGFQFVGIRVLCSSSPSEFCSRDSEPSSTFHFRAAVGIDLPGSTWCQACFVSKILPSTPTAGFLVWLLVSLLLVATKRNEPPSFAMHPSIRWRASKGRPGSPLILSHLFRGIVRTSGRALRHSSTVGPASSNSGPRNPTVSCTQL